MEVGKLTVQQRATTGKGISRSTRRSGDVPGVCYGAGMETPIPVTINPKALRLSLDPAKKRNTIIDLTIEGGDSPVSVKALLWDYQIHPLRQVLTHVDLKAIDPNKVVEAEVPLTPQGKHKGLIEGGLLSWSRHSVQIEARPDQIPSELLVDVSDLGLGDNLHVADIPLPEGVTFADSPKLTVVTCVAPKGLKSDLKKEGEAEAAPVAAKAEKPADK